MADDALTAAVMRRLYPNGSDPTATASATPATTPATPDLSTLLAPQTDSGTYDPTYESAMQGITGQENQVNDQYSQQLQALRNAYLPQYQGMQQQYGDDQTSLQNQLAQNGILYSSNNAQAQGQLGAQYQQQYGALQSQQQAGETGLATGHNSSLQDLLTQSLSAQGAHAGFLATDAENRAAAQAAAAAATAQKGDTDRQNIQQGLDAGLTPDQISAQLGIPVIGISSNATGQYVPSTTVTTPLGTVAPSSQAPQPGGQTASPQDEANVLLQNLTQGLDQNNNSPWAIGQADQALQTAQNNPDLSGLLQSSMFDAIRRRLGLPVADRSAPSSDTVSSLLRSGLSPDMVGL